MEYCDIKDQKTRCSFVKQWFLTLLDQVVGIFDFQLGQDLKNNEKFLGHRILDLETLPAICFKKKALLQYVAISNMNIHYSQVPIKQVGPNKQVGWIF